ncbi:MAG TPA: MBL fold metallo-hydrolase [Chryseolinea sp.]|nr:MBL fold metallo-hydrolase [Chryseolinea sp.]
MRISTITIFCWLLVTFACQTISIAQKISPSVTFVDSPVNGVVIQRKGKTLIVYGDPSGGVKKADIVLFTHFRRDLTWSGRELLKHGAEGFAPAGQKQYFLNVDSMWQSLTRSRFHDYANQTTKFPVVPLNIKRFVRGGDVIHWNGLDIDIVDTPGYTRHSVSYLINIDSKRIAFTGDLIYGDGKVFDLYSFQDALPGVDGYHGYAVRLGDLIQSLERIAAQKPDVIIPSRGPVITEPALAIQKLIQRIRWLYTNYLSITAQRWNHTDRMLALSNHVLGEANSVDWMPFASIIESPSWYRHVGSSNLIWAEDSSAFLIDCGSSKVVEDLKALRSSGRLKSIDGIFITHYHDDHTDFVNEVSALFGAPVYITEELKDIISRPGDYRMPCLTTKGIENLKVVEDGTKMKWKDFKFTFFYFPGQTLYHDAMLCERSPQEIVFFAGDSFTPAGIDDYCFQNRNWLHENAGYFYCLDVLRKLPANALLSNQHIAPLFRFSRTQIDHMSDVLVKRSEIIGELLPWDDINFGTDENWMGIYPYARQAVRGSVVEYSVRVFNHSDVTRTFEFQPTLPEGFTIERTMVPLEIGPRSEGKATFSVKLSRKAPDGVSIILLGVKFDKWDLREWTEALIEL